MDETMSQDLNSAPCCRICHERSDELIKPCNCRGTMATVHQECIQMWLTHRNPDQMTCELCGYPFRMTMRTKSVFCFLFSAGFWWKNLVHIAYIALIARRMWIQAGVVAKVIPHARKKSWPFLWRLCLHCLMLGHYSVFLLVDIPFLVKRWLRWRHMTAELVVHEKV
mmetsp:Transcript_22615/g.90646  ORF Transcript_22615/g.90646 Transcript_22615/m.90646 type:complete len:167 (+) Transcript_22615:87-587(+)